MKPIKVYHYDAFSNIPNMGNPAGVVLNGEDLSDEQMREIAEKVGFNETAFPLVSDKADLRIRYFTPGHEINLCGHATMATLYALQTKGLLDNKTALTLETKAGVLPIRFTFDSIGGLYITMKQAAPQFQEFNGSLRDLALSMGVEDEDIDRNLPTLYGSTGIWTLLIPVKNLNTFKKMKPNNALFPDILKEMPKASIHPFCLETYDSDAHMHARHFSSPFSGTIEDPVTGTASGVMGAYYARYINNSSDSLIKLVVEQGHEIGKHGRVGVSVSRSNGQFDIEITGSAVYVKEYEILI
ncbi:PhzF family phenazine biosynthesis protein [Paenibacillus eucommiae]|uniref:PhzF family phenazine biosynthesis protein n=1 Tax=Paenibacillus eucommiae TaxID=1355755 RepID=A0ABS4J6H9_9BACL|nr:PhzF family phenazine biosynthesis protein [Paenibacillus eucommiae]MBP1994885.1 PhzF family phenazine biosynthesis protein [Paenibacillus eucommiae]